MSKVPWLTIIGLGEDGPAGLSKASRAAIDRAETVMGPPRHLALLGPVTAKTVEWPVPFEDGLALLHGLRGRPTVVLTSGDPFWFGAGSVIARDLAPSEWQAHPAPSTFSLVAARMGWPLETTVCLGLHAAPLSRMVPHLAKGARLIVLLRDAAALSALSDLLLDRGFRDTAITICESMGGPRERLTPTGPGRIDTADHTAPLCVALEIAGDGAALPQTCGLPDDWFDHDGQITKRPIRALTLSALAPRRDAHLWDIGAGSGSIGIEWLLSHPSTTATAVEVNPERAARIRANALRLGVDRLQVIDGDVAQHLATLSRPDAVFVGGGLNTALLNGLWSVIPPGCRLVANAVTLETEALLTQAHGEKGGTLLRVELSEPAPLGPQTRLAHHLPRRAMERDPMKRIAGFGFRAEASIGSLQSALAAAGGAAGLTGLATARDKTTAPSLTALAERLALPIKGVDADDLAAAETLTQSPRSLEQRGTGSLAEAAALSAAGPGARLTGPRQIAQDRMATCAIATGPET